MPRLALPPSLLPEHENDDKIQERRSQFSCPLPSFHNPQHAKPQNRGKQLLGREEWRIMDGGSPLASHHTSCAHALKFDCGRPIDRRFL